MPIFTLNSCTIEVPKGGRSAKATRHGTGETAEFAVLGIDGAPTPQVQATRWALGMPAWEPKSPVAPEAQVLSSKELGGLFYDTITGPAEAATDAPDETDLDEATDGQ